MKKLFALTLILFSSIFVFAQTDGIRKHHFNLENGVAISGYDPVSYFKGKPVAGKKTISYTYMGITYLFESAGNIETFKSAPEKYEPAYGGWCAYAMGAKGEKVEIDPETFKIVNGKLYLFYNKFFNNTLTDWNKNEASLRKNADANWIKLSK